MGHYLNPQPIANQMRHPFIIISGQSVNTVSVSDYKTLFAFACNKCGLCMFIFIIAEQELTLILFFFFSEHHISQYIMGNGTSRPLMTQDSRKNIRRNEKLTEDDPKDKVPFANALRKDKHSKVLSKKDYSVAKLILHEAIESVTAIYHQHWSFSRNNCQVQSWEMCNPAFVEENISQS